MLASRALLIPGWLRWCDSRARLKGDARTRAIPVVMLTSSKEQRDLVESYQLGVNSYIVKPVDFENFVAAARELGTRWLLLNQAPAA